MKQMRLYVILTALVVVATALFFARQKVTLRANRDTHTLATAHTPTGTRPLRLMMVELGQDMNRINDGFWHEDASMIARAAQAVSSHPRVPPEEMRKIQQLLGKDFEEFRKYDMQVHETAARLAEEAQQTAPAGLIELYGRVQQGCTSCHSAFRQRVREGLYTRP